MGVLQHQDVRLQLGGARQHLAGGVEDLHPAQLGIHGVDGRVAGVEPEQRSQKRQHRQEPFVEPAQLRFELGAHDERRVDVIDVAAPTQHLDDRMKRRRAAERHRARLDPRRAVAEQPAKLAQEA